MFRRILHVGKDLQLLASQKLFGWLERLCEDQSPKLMFVPSIGYLDPFLVHRGAPTIPSIVFLKWAGFWSDQLQDQRMCVQTRIRQSTGP